jgi:hypothetical protein
MARPFRLQDRRPVWSALSSLFLDTDTTLLVDYMVRTLSASPYSLDELNTILIDEVYPACRWNLFSVAGEWAGFDEEWLERRITQRLDSPLRSLHWLNLGRITVPTSLVWRRVRREIAVRRATNGTVPGEAETDNAG